jgi:phage shock protein C
MQVNRRLYRCRENRVIAGVASGVAEFFGLDPTLVRVLWFLSIFFGGVTLVVYVGLALIVPLEPATAGAVAEPVEPHRHGAAASGRWTTIFGIALILFGSLALLGAVLPNVASWRHLWPLFIIGMGAVLVAVAMRRDAPPTVTYPQVAVPQPSEPKEPAES